MSEDKEISNYISAYRETFEFLNGLYNEKDDEKFKARVDKFFEGDCKDLGELEKIMNQKDDDKQYKAERFGV